MNYTTANLSISCKWVVRYHVWRRNHLWHYLDWDSLTKECVVIFAQDLRTVAQVTKDAGTEIRGVHEIQVTLRKYGFSPGSLRVRKGEQVRLIMAAVDHDHGFRLDDFQINQKIPKGTTAIVEFTADKAGSFQFHCSNVCGLGHRNMKGTLVVEE